MSICRLASYMESAHEFFAESFEGVFSTEADAERFALASQQRLWALVVVRHEYTCMCSTVPSLVVLRM